MEALGGSTATERGCSKGTQHGNQTCGESLLTEYWKQPDHGLNGRGGIEQL